MAEPPDVGAAGDGLAEGYRRQQAWMRHLAVAAVAVVLAATLATTAGSVAVATRLLDRFGRLQDAADRNGAELARLRDEVARDNERVRTLEDLLRANGVAVPPAPLPPPSPPTTSTTRPGKGRSTSAPQRPAPQTTTTAEPPSPTGTNPQPTSPPTTRPPPPPSTTTPCRLPALPPPICLPSTP